MIRHYEGAAALPINLRRIGYDGKPEYLYYYATNKDGRFAVRAIYTGLPTGCIGSSGKSFATEAEREAALRASVERFAQNTARMARGQWSIVTPEGN